MVALSSGVAAAGEIELTADDYPAQGRSPWGAAVCRHSDPPPGFPVELEGCEDSPSVPTEPRLIDPIALELELRVPSDAHALAFDFAFFTHEYPIDDCEPYNDHFVALLSSSHPSTPDDENISFDAEGRVISAATAFMRICNPWPHHEEPCEQRTGELSGTGFEMEDGLIGSTGGATGWLTSRAPVVPGETIRLRFAIWDAQDSVADSTVLLDNLRWEQDGSEAAPEPEGPVTTPVTLI